jgi:hypothetical protein
LDSAGSLERETRWPVTNDQFFPAIVVGLLCRALLRRIFDIVPVNIRDTPRVGTLVCDSASLVFLCASGDLFVPTFFGFRSLFL